MNSEEVFGVADSVKLWMASALSSQYISAPVGASRISAIIKARIIFASVGFFRIVDAMAIGTIGKIASSISLIVCKKEGK